MTIQVLRTAVCGLLLIDCLSPCKRSNRSILMKKKSLCGPSMTQCTKASSPSLQKFQTVSNKSLLSLSFERLPLQFQVSQEHDVIECGLHAVCNPWQCFFSYGRCCCHCDNVIGSAPSTADRVSSQDGA